MVPTGYCYPHIIMTGEWGRRERCPTEWRYLTSSDGPSSRSKNGKGDAIVSEDSPIASEAAMDRACPKGDPVSRRKAAKYRKERQKKAAKEGGQGECREGVGGEGEHEEKAGSSANRYLGNNERRQKSCQDGGAQGSGAASRQAPNKIEARKLKLTLGLGDAC